MSNKPLIAGLAGLLAATAVTVTSLPAGSLSWAKLSGLWTQQQEFKLTWPAVTTRADGTPLPYAELKSYVLHSSIDGSLSLQTKRQIVDKKLTSIKIKQPVCTEYAYSISAIDSVGREGHPSLLRWVKTWCPPK